MSIVTKQIKTLNKREYNNYPEVTEAITGTLTGARTDTGVVFYWQRLSAVLVQISGAISTSNAVAADSITWTPNDNTVLDKYKISLTGFAYVRGINNSAATRCICQPSALKNVKFFNGDGASFTNAQPCAINQFTCIFYAPLS